MYYGVDGRQYDSRYAAVGYEPSPQDLRRQRIAELNKQLRSGYGPDQQLQKQKAQQQSDQNMYDTADQFRRQHGRTLPQEQPGYGMAGAAPTGQKSQGKQGYGMPGKYVENRIDNNLAGEVGKLNKFAHQYVRGVDDEGKPVTKQEASDRITNFVNTHPWIGIDNATYATVDNDVVSIFGADQDAPIKQFNHSALSNLNNYASRVHNDYVSERQVKGDINELMSSLKDHAGGMARDDHAHLNQDQQSTKDQISTATRQYLDQYYDRFLPRSGGYEQGKTETPHQTWPFGPQQNSNTGRDRLDSLVPPPPPPRR